MLSLANRILFFANLNLHCFVKPQNEKKAFVEFESNYNFILELRNNSDNLLNYVSQIQTIFCPEQPICSGNVNQDRSLVMRNVYGNLHIGNYSLKVEAIHTFVGVCCLPCSCEDTCHEHGYCCLTKFLNSSAIVRDASGIPIVNDRSGRRFTNATSDTTSLTDANVTKPVRSECITASVKSYIDKNDVGAWNWKQPSYFMITHCVDESNNTRVAKCQNPSADDMNDTVPVTSLKTGHTYWNRQCAFCNKDIEDILEWKSTAHFENDLLFFANTSRISVYPKTTEGLHRLFISKGDILYTPPFPMEDKRCLTSLLDCEKPEFGEIMFDLPWPCRQFTSPIQIEVKESRIFPFRNIFCFFCRKRVLMPKENVYCNSDLEIEKDISIRMTALLDYKSTEDPKAFTDLRAGLELGNRKCSCNEIYDIYLVSLRLPYLPLMFALILKAPGKIYSR